MKRAYRWILICSIAFVTLAMKINSMIAIEETTISLSDAISKKVITGEFKGTGNYSGFAMNVSLNNLQQKKISLLIPAGTMFKPSDDGAQNILVPEDKILVLKPGEKINSVLTGFCCEASDKAPSKDMKFSLSSNKDPKMLKLYAAVKGKSYSNDVLQDAIWCVSDNHSVSDIYAPNMNAIKPLRDELCKITGQKDTWYSTPKMHSVDASGNISHTTTSVNGLVKFKAVKASKIHNEIHDANGNLVIKNPNEFTVRPGNVEYDFEIKVQNWEKGTYFVKVYEDDKVVHQQEFKI